MILTVDELRRRADEALARVREAERAQSRYLATHAACSYLETASVIAWAEAMTKDIKKARAAWLKAEKAWSHAK